MLVAPVNLCATRGGEGVMFTPGEGRERAVIPSLAQETWWDWLEGSPMPLALEKVPVCFTFSNTSASAVEKAFRTIAGSQEALRLCFEKNATGLRASLISPDEIRIRHIDARKRATSCNIKKRAAGIIQRHLNIPLARDSRQLINAIIVNMPNDSVIFAANFHHLIFDGNSRDIFIQQMNTLLKPGGRGKGSPPDISGRFLDQAAFERDWVNTCVGQARIRYWENWYRSVGTITLPGSEKNLACTGGLMNAYPFSLSPEVTARLTAVARASKVSDFALWLAIYAICLGKWSSCHHFALRAVGNSRSSKQLLQVVGLMLCYDPIKVDISPDEPVGSTAKNLMREYLRALGLRLPILPKSVASNLPQQKIPIVINFKPLLEGGGKARAMNKEGEGVWPSPSRICSNVETPIPFSAIHLKSWYVGKMLCGQLELNAGIIPSYERERLLDIFAATLRHSLNA